MDGSSLRKDFPKRLKFVREMRGMTQSEVARKADCDPRVICFYETGQRLPGAEALCGLSKALLVSADYLLGLTQKVER